MHSPMEIFAAIHVFTDGRGKKTMGGEMRMGPHYCLCAWEKECYTGLVINRTGNLMKVHILQY